MKSGEMGNIFYLDLSDDALFEGWNELENPHFAPAFRWSKGESKINVQGLGKSWCSLRIHRSKTNDGYFSIWLDGKHKIFEDKAEEAKQEFSFYLPDDTDFLLLKTSPWRPCDYSASEDKRTLGVALSKACFTGFCHNYFPVIENKAEKFAKNCAEKLSNSTPEEVIRFCQEAKKSTTKTSESIAVIYGCLVYLLETFPQISIKKMDANGELSRFLATADMPYHDAGGIIYICFSRHKEAFYRSTLDEEATAQWRGNVNFLLKKQDQKMILDRPIGEVFWVTEKISLLFLAGNIYMNDSEAKFFHQMFFSKLIGLDSKIAMLKVHRAAELLEYERLKAQVEAPWCEADGRMRKEIRDFRHLYPHSEKYDLLMGLFFLRKANFDRAKRYAFIGLRRRRLDYNLCALMGDICLQMGKFEEAANYYGRMLAKNAGKNRQWMVLDNNELNADANTRKRIASLFSQAEAHSPEMLARCTEEVGRVLITERARYGSQERLVYNDGKFSIAEWKDGELHGIKSGKDVFYVGNRKREGLPNFEVEYRQGELYKEYTADINGKYILPLMALSKDSGISIDYKGVHACYDDGNKIVNRFPEGNWQYLRLEGKCGIQSAREIMIGKPIPILHRKKNKRLVLNLFIDALSMNEIKDNLPLYMPETYKFFSRGIIFRQAYGASDWTHPCTSSMFYGLELRKHQLFHERINLRQVPGYRSVAEHLHDQGYYCCNSFFDIPRFLANDAYRGYDMHLAAGVGADVYLLEALHLLEDLPTDTFLNLHFMDVHQANFNAHESWTQDINTLEIPFEQVMRNDMFVAGNENLPIEEQRDGRQNVYFSEISRLDRKLGRLYDFIIEHYKESEFLVVLHSDHGGGKTNLETRHHCNIAMMARGDGVPVRGFVDDEVVSALDYFSIYSHCCGFEPKLKTDSRLPRVFGGPGREYAVTQRLYHGQHYVISVNDLQYEYYLNTNADTLYDGKISWGDYEAHLYHHVDGRRDEVFDSELLGKYFQLAYDNFKYLDEPEMSNCKDNIFMKLLSHKIENRKTLVSIILDCRYEENIFPCLDSIMGQYMSEFSLLMLVEKSSYDFYQKNYSRVIQDTRVKLLPVSEGKKWQEISRFIKGKYLLFLEGHEVFAPTALEAMYNTAEQYKADAVENVLAFEMNSQVKGFPMDRYDQYMNKIVKGSVNWQPHKVSGNISDRISLWQNEMPKHLGCMLVSRDFLRKSSINPLQSEYGWAELFVFQLLFHAPSYVRISAPIYAYQIWDKNKDLDKSLRSLMSCMRILDEELSAIPYLQEKPELQDSVRERLYLSFEENYLKDASRERLGVAVKSLFQKHNQISRWLVEYMFMRGMEKLKV